jgi:pimeloyl-ACP methyl ester carboxylesterase
MLRKTMIWTATSLIVVLIGLACFFLWDIRVHYDRIAQKGQVIHSPYGDIEYSERGSGTPVLVIHGSGGGYDQGELIVEAVLGDEFRSITPSRFGYLRSTFKAGATWDEQAHAYAYLLDQLGIDRVAVVAMSHGGPSALLFAALHPERVTSLALVSCGVATSSTGSQAEADKKGDRLTSIFRFDFPYWAISRFFKKQFMELMGASEGVIEALTEPQRKLIDRIIDYMNPVSVRSAGAAFDNRAKLPGQRIAAIKAPTLILHARDDTLQLFHNAEFAAATIPNARLIAFARGGHVVIAVEQAVVRSATRAHILSHSPPSL